MAGSACGSEIDELAPADGVRANVELNTDRTVDVDLKDDTGRTFPARIYFNEAAAPLVGPLTELTVVVTDPSLLKKPPGGERSYGGDRVRTIHRIEGPWFYIRLGVAEDGTRAVGWSAPYEAITLPLPEVVSPTVDGTDDGSAVHTIGALSQITYNFSLSSGNRTQDTSEIECSEGAQTDQITSFFSSGAGTLRLFGDGLQQDSNTYSNGSDWADAWDNLANATWFVRNGWVSGTPNGNSCGTGCPAGSLHFLCHEDIP